MGYGVWAPYLPMVDFNDLYRLPSFTGDEAVPRIAQDWYLDGLSAPAPIEISWLWLAPPLRFREDKAITYASISRGSSTPAIASVPASEQIDFTATLDAYNTIDAPNLAHFMITYYDQPRVRCPQLRFILNNRSQTEQWTILGANIGDRIHIPDVPVGWPSGADNLVIEGIARTTLAETSVVEWATSPVIGDTVGQVGPFFRVGVSKLDGLTDPLPW